MSSPRASGGLASSLKGGETGRIVSKTTKNSPVWMKSHVKDQTWAKGEARCSDPGSGFGWQQNSRRSGWSNICSKTSTRSRGLERSSGEHLERVSFHPCEAVLDSLRQSRQNQQVSPTAPVPVPHLIVNLVCPQTHPEKKPQSRSGSLVLTWSCGNQTSKTFIDQTDQPEPVHLSPLFTKTFRPDWPKRGPSLKSPG